MSNPYEVLGVANNATAEQIKAAYRRKCKEHHPDRAHGDDAKMLEVRAAYDVLKDPKRRALFDSSGSTADPAILKRDAENTVCFWFRNFMLEGDDSLDPIPAIKRKLRELEAQHREALRTLQQQLKRAECRKSLVRLKAGAERENSYTIIAESLIEEIKRGLTGCKAAIAVIPLALEILDSYESDSPRSPWSTVSLKYGTAYSDITPVS